MVAVCHEVGKTQDGITANTDALASKFDMDNDSYAATTGVKLAHALGDPVEVFAALRKSGVYDTIVDSCKTQGKELPYHSEQNEFER